MDNFIDKGTYFLLSSWQVAQQRELLCNKFFPHRTKITKHISGFASVEFEKGFPLRAVWENTLQTLFLCFSEILSQEFPTSSQYILFNYISLGFLESYAFVDRVKNEFIIATFN